MTIEWQIRLQSPGLRDKKKIPPWGQTTLLTFSSSSANGWPFSAINSMANLGGKRKKNLPPQALSCLARVGSLGDQPAISRLHGHYIHGCPVLSRPQDQSHLPYPIAELNSSVVPKASNTWSSLDLLSPVKVLENPVKNKVSHLKIGHSFPAMHFLENFLFPV